MTVKYDKETDVLYIQMNDREVYETDRNDKGIIIDYDVDGLVVGIEILHASTSTSEPNKIAYEVA